MANILKNRAIDAQVSIVDGTTGAAAGNLPAATAFTADSKTAPTAPIIGAVVYGIDQGSNPFTYSTPRVHDSQNDARINTIIGFVTQSRLYVHNHNTPGTGTDDIVRSARAADSFTGTGVPAFGPMLWDGAAVRHLKGNTDGSLPVGGFAPAAPTCTFTRGANQTPYTIGDEVGTASTAPTTIAVGRINGGSGIIQGANVLYSSYTAIVPQLVVLIFSATVTLAGDNAQLLLSDADAAKLVCAIPLTASQSTQYSAGAPVAAGGVWLSGVPTQPAPHFVLGASEQTLYACLITLNAFTPVASSETLVLQLSVELN